MSSLGFDVNVQEILRAGGCHTAGNSISEPDSCYHSPVVPSIGMLLEHGVNILVPSVLFRTRSWDGLAATWPVH